MGSLGFDFGVLATGLWAVGNLGFNGLGARMWRSGRNMGGP